jgi:hypothetical protein
MFHVFHDYATHKYNLRQCLTYGVRQRVIKQWINGDTISKIAIGNNIGQGTVSSIVND